MKFLEIFKENKTYILKLQSLFDNDDHFVQSDDKGEIEKYTRMLLQKYRKESEQVTISDYTNDEFVHLFTDCHKINFD